MSDFELQILISLCFIIAQGVVNFWLAWLIGGLTARLDSLTGGSK